jgi:hypothetical protein
VMLFPVYEAVMLDEDTLIEIPRFVYGLYL